MNYFYPPLITIVCCLLLLCGTTKAQVVLNEFSAANFSQFTDNNGEYEDWIELYNTGSTAANIGGYYLSDRIDQPLKYQIPGGVTIAPNDHLRIWASGNDVYSGGVIHTNFKITQTRTAEYIVFSDNFGMVVDTHAIETPNKKHHSWARTTDGGPNWGVATSPTPNNNNTNVQEPYATRPEISPVAGFYSGSVSVSIFTPDPNVTIFYTTDGSEPTAGDTPYSGPFTLSVTSVVKAIAISSSPNIPDSHLDVHTFFINDAHSIPVVSISGSGLPNLLGGATSARPEGYLEYFDAAGQRVSDSSGEFNKHGNDSWAYPQRGIDYIARDQFGDDYAIKHQIFAGKTRDRFQRVILKAAANDNYPFANGAHIRDSYVHHLSQQAGLELDERTHESCILYLNGEYWGVYDIREKVDDHDFTKYYYDQGRQWIDFIKTWGSTWAEYGSINDWNVLNDFVINNDMSNSANYAYVQTELEVLSLIDYMIINTHSVCKDWLNWNTAWWRGRKPGGGALKWRYTLWDMDATFGHYINYTGIPDVSPYADPCDIEDISTDFEGHTDMLISLMENEEFFALYINRYADLNNTYLSCDYMISLLDEMINIIDPEMPGQINRWGGNYNTWLNEVQEIRDFILTRCDIIDQGIVDCYDVTGPFEIVVDVNPPAAGNVQINDIVGDTYPWTVTYFGGVPVSMTALPNAGYQFSHWTLSNNTLSPNNNTDAVTTDFGAADNITAHFTVIGCTLNPAINGASELCDGDQSILTVSPAFNSYLWSDNSTTQSITVNTSGNYSVTVSNGLGCTEATTFSIASAPSPNLIIGGNDYFCENDFTTLDAGAGYSSYLWSDNSVDQELFVTETGTYFVTVTNAEGCSAVDQVEVTEMPLPVPTIEGLAQFCEGENTVLYVDDIYNSYLWSNGLETAEITVTEANTYSVTVVDPTGCVGNNSYTVTINPSPTPVISGDELLCANQSGTLDGGSNYVAYLWSDNSNGQTLTINVGGTYFLTVTDNAGCTGTDEIIVTQNDTVAAEINGELVFCEGNNTTLSLSQTFESYLWSDNSSNPTLTVNQSGNYGVTVTDSDGCTGISTAEVLQSEEVLPEILGDLSFCSGGNTILSLSQNYQSYLWSDNSSNPTLEVNQEGTYNVIVTDDTGCTGGVEVLVIQNEEVLAEILGNLEFCEGENTTLSLSQNYAAYLWSDNSNDPDLTVTQPGIYNVIVTDDNGCTGTSEVEVLQNEAILPEIIGELFFCEGNSTELSLSENYSTYLWSDNSTDPTLETSTPGIYSIEVTDEFGCIGNSSVEVIQNSEVVPQIIGDLEFCNGESTLLSLSETYSSYLWSDNSSESTLEVNQSGSYSVIVTDTEGCTGTVEAVLNQNEEIDANIIGAQTFCEGSSSLLSLSETYANYLWNDNSTQATLDVTVEGFYNVIVTDDNGCTGIAEIEVTQSEEIDAQIIGALSFCEGSSTILSLSQNYATYLWSDNSNTPTLEVSQAGIYTVSVTDNTGCSGTTQVEVIQSEEIAVQIIGDLEFCSGNNTLLSLDQNYNSYLWSDNSSDPTLNVSQSGVYNVIVTDDNGCTGTTEVEVIQNDEVVVQILGDLDFCSGSNTTLSLSQNYSNYLWSDNSSDPTLNVSQAGIYNVIVTDDNSCTGTTEVEVIQNEEINAQIIGALSFCEGSSTTLSLSQNYANYSWSDNSNNATLEVTTPGVYSVIITDDAGCSGTTEVEVIMSDEIDAQIIGALSFCEGSSTTLSLSQNYANYTWSDNSNNATLEVTTPGFYSVIITDDAGCSGTAEVEVIMSEEIDAQIIGALSFCEGSSTTLSLSQNYANYAWSDNSNTPTLEVTTPGFYSVVITDDAGCSGTAEVEVIMSEEIDAQIIGALSFCEGSSTTLSLSQNYANYAWSDNSNTPTLEVTTPGFYSVVITDDAGCSGTAEVEVIMSEEIDAQIIGALSFCEGSSTTLSLSQNYANYTWSDNSNNATLEVTTPGFYSVVITDDAGCSGTAEVEVIMSEEIDAQIIGALSFCEGSSTTLSLSQNYANYAWSDNSNTPTLEVTTPGFYSVVITDDAGCSGTAEVEVIMSDEIDAQIIGALSFCEGSSTTLSLSQNYANYTWSDNSNNATLEVSTPGVYGVVITDDAGCSGAAEVEVVMSEEIDAQIIGALSFCEGSSTTLSLSQNYANYQWSNNSTDPTLEVTQAGLYNIIVTNNFGCTGMAFTEVIQNQIIAPEIIGPLAFCDGGSTALAVANIYAQYQWSTGSTTSSVDVFASGTYLVTVTSSEGCTAVDAFEITALTTVETDQEITLCFGESLSVGNSVYDESGDYINFLVSSDGCDSIVYTLLEIEAEILTSGEATICYGDNYEGTTYTQSTDILFQLTTNNGCDSTHTVHLTVLSEMTATVYSNSNCSGSGTVSASTFGGTGVYYYLWNNGATTQTQSNIPSGNYSVTITDSWGCSTTAMGNVKTITPIEFDYEVEPISCFGEADATIAAIAVSGTPPYSYEWSTGDTTPELENMPAGTYTLFITDANGCLFITTIAVPQPDVLTIDPVVTGTLGNDGTATALVSGGTTPYNYEWQNGQTSATIIGLSIGLYNVTVTDAHGCTTVATVEVGVPTATNEINELLQLTLSPNPGAGLFRLQLALASTKEIQYQVFGINGTRLLSYDSEMAVDQLDQMIDLQNQAAGVYIVVFKIGKQRIVRKLVVNR